MIEYRGAKYWKGPYDVLVPITTRKIYAQDGYNWLYKDGMETEILFISRPIFKKRYLKKFCTKKWNRYFYTYPDDI